MTIKERNEINPDMAEIVRKILLKQKKEKNKKNFNNHSVSVRKDRKVKSLRKYFNENYNNKNKETKKENEFNNNNDNNTLILNPLTLTNLEFNFSKNNISDLFPFNHLLS